MTIAKIFFRSALFCFDERCFYTATSGKNEKGADNLSETKEFHDENCFILPTTT